jgi:hypothetical protein
VSHYQREKSSHCLLELAALNDGIVALMDWLEGRNSASQMSHFCAHPHEALHLLFGRLEPQNG